MRAPFLATLVLTVTLACACFGAVMAVVMAAVEPVPIPGLDATQRQDAETALYVTAFFVILPAALLLVPRLADAVARGPSRSALPGLAALLAAGLAVGVLVVRLSSVVSGGGGKAALLAMLCGWGVVAAGLLWRAASPRLWRAASRRSSVRWRSQRPFSCSAPCSRSRGSPRSIRWCWSSERCSSPRSR